MPTNSNCCLLGCVPISFFKEKIVIFVLQILLTTACIEFKKERNKKNIFNVNPILHLKHSPNFQRRIFTDNLHFKGKPYFMFLFLLPKRKCVLIQIYENNFKHFHKRKWYFSIFILSVILF